MTEASFEKTVDKAKIHLDEMFAEIDIEISGIASECRMHRIKDMYSTPAYYKVLASILARDIELEEKI